jgi:hypothetical protein
MLLRIPWNHTISLKNNSTILVASSVLWHVIKCHLENLSTTTKIDLGKPKIKFIEMSTHSSLGTSKSIQAMWLSPKLCFPTSYAFVTYMVHIFLHFMPIKMLLQCIQSLNNTKMPHQPVPMNVQEIHALNLIEHINDSL